MTRKISNIIPNPFTAYELVNKIVDFLLEKYEEQTLAANTIFLVNKIEQWLLNIQDIKAEQIFKELVEKRELKFILQETQGKLPIDISKFKVPKVARKLRDNNDDPIEKSLVEPVLEDQFNNYEREVVLYAEEQEKLLFWYRNVAKMDFYIQGWRKQKVYPDFIMAEKPVNSNDKYSGMYIIETKGEHLLNNDDSTYKESLFSYINEIGEKYGFDKMGLKPADQNIKFYFVNENNWEEEVAKIFND